MPPAIRSRTFASRWNAISSSRSRSIRRLRTNAHNRFTTDISRIITTVSCSRRLQHPRDRKRDPLVGLELRPQLPAAEAGQAVVARAPPGIRLPPFRSDESLHLQALECRVERAFADLNDVRRSLPDGLGDAVAMH